MRDLAALPIIALAVWRLGHLLAYERGPYELLIHIRRLCGIVPDEDGKPAQWTGELAEWIVCDWCRGIVLSLLLVWAWTRYPRAVLSLAAAAGALWFGKRM